MAKDTNRPVCPWCQKPLFEVEVDYQFIRQAVDDQGNVVPKILDTSNLEVSEVVCPECGHTLDPYLYSTPAREGTTKWFLNIA